MCYRKWSCSVISDSLRPRGLKPTRLLRPWDSPGKNTGVGCHSLLQEIFPTQGLNPGLLHCRQTLYRLSHQGSLECAIAEHKMATSVQLPGDFTCSIQHIGLLQCSCSKRSHCNLILFSFNNCLYSKNKRNISGTTLEHSDRQQTLLLLQRYWESVLCLVHSYS